MDLELEVPEGEALSLVSTPTRIGNTTCRPHNRRQPGSEKKSRVRARLEPGKMRVGYPHEGGVAQSSLSETPTDISKPPRREDRRDGRRKGRSPSAFRRAVGRLFEIASSNTFLAALCLSNCPAIIIDCVPVPRFLWSTGLDLIISAPATKYLNSSWAIDCKADHSSVSFLYQPCAALRLASVSSEVELGAVSAKNAS